MFSDFSLALNAYCTYHIDLTSLKIVADHGLMFEQSRPMFDQIARRRRKPNQSQICPLEARPSHRMMSPDVKRVFSHKYGASTLEIHYTDVV